MIKTNDEIAKAQHQPKIQLQQPNDKESDRLGSSLSSNRPQTYIPPIDINDLKSLIIDEEWYNIPTCVKLCITKLIEFSESHKMTVDRSESFILKKIKEIEAQATLDRGNQKQVDAEINNKIDARQKQTLEANKKIKLEIEMN